MTNTLVYLRPLRVAYVRATGTYARSSEEAWKRLFAWLDENGMHAIPGCGYGLVLDNPLQTQPADCRYDACIETATLPEHCYEGSLQVRKLPGGAYVRQRMTGCYHDMRASTFDFANTWQSDKGLLFDERRPLVQIFLDDPRRCRDDQLRSDICVPVMSQILASSG